MDENEFKDLKQHSWEGFEEYDNDADEEEEETTTPKATTTKTTTSKATTTKTSTPKATTRQESLIALSREVKRNQTSTTQVFETSLETTSRQSVEDDAAKRRRYYKVLFEAVSSMPWEESDQKMDNSTL